MRSAPRAAPRLRKPKPIQVCNVGEKATELKNPSSFSSVGSAPMLKKWLPAYSRFMRLTGMTPTNTGLSGAFSPGREARTRPIKSFFFDSRLPSPKSAADVVPLSSFPATWPFQCA